MRKKLRQLVEQLAVDPSLANRDAFRRGLVMSMVWTPLYVAGAETTVPSDPMTVGPGGEPLALLFTEGSSARQAFAVESAAGESGRSALERALASKVGLAIATGAEPTAPRAIVSENEVASVLALERFDDPVLGVITWYPLSDDEGFWRFDAGPVDGHSVAGVVVPLSPWEPIDPNDLPRIRKTVLWALANDAADLYWRRWNCELDIRAIKHCLHMDVLRAKTPEMIRKEIWAHLLAWNLLRGVMVESAKRHDALPRELSVKGTMQAIESFTPTMMAIDGDPAIYDAMLLTVSAHRVADRPGRQEPRYKKRRPTWSKYLTVPRNQLHRRLAAEARS